MEAHKNCGLSTLTEEQVKFCYKDSKVGLKLSDFGSHVYRKNFIKET
jgi:hypothetical protein